MFVVAVRVGAERVFIKSLATQKATFFDQARENIFPPPF